MTIAFSPGSFGVAVSTGWTKEELEASGLLPDFDVMDSDDLLEWVCQHIAQADPMRICQFVSFALPFRCHRELIKTALR